VIWFTLSDMVHPKEEDLYQVCSTVKHCTRSCTIMYNHHTVQNVHPVRMYKCTTSCSLHLRLCSLHCTIYGSVYILYSHWCIRRTSMRDLHARNTFNVLQLAVCAAVAWVRGTHLSPTLWTPRQEIEARN